MCLHLKFWPLKVTKDLLKEQEESLRIVTEKLGLKKQIISSDMARSAVDEAMKNILLPQIEKEKLVEQLQVVRKHRYF